MVRRHKIVGEPSYKVTEYVDTYTTLNEAEKHSRAIMAASDRWTATVFPVKVKEEYEG